MPLRLKRWTYRINQHDIVLECGFTLWGWAQARLVVDGAELAHRKGCRFWPLSLETRVDAAQPAMPIRAVITPGLFSVHNEFWAHGVPAAAPDRASRAGWTRRAGAGLTPDPHDVPHKNAPSWRLSPASRATP